MTKDQYEKVKEFKPQFKLAKTNFVRISRGDLEIIRNVYNELFKKDLKPANLNCNSCVIKMMKEMCDAVEKYEIYLSKFGKKSAVNSNNPEQKPAE